MMCRASTDQDFNQVDKAQKNLDDLQNILIWRIKDLLENLTTKENVLE